MFYSDPAFAEGGCEVGTPLLLAGALQRTRKECLPRRAGSAPRTDLCCAMAITLPKESKSQRPRQLTPALLAHHCSLFVLNTIWEMALNNPCPFLQGVPQPSVPAHPHRGQPGTPLPSSTRMLQEGSSTTPKLPFSGQPASLRANKWTDKQIQPCG